MDAHSFNPARLIHPLLFLALCPPAVNRCFAAEPLPTISEQTAVITDRFGLSLVADIDLGLLPRGTPGIVALTLLNNSSETSELGPAFVLTGSDHVSNLVRRTQQQFKRSAS